MICPVCKKNNRKSCVFPGVSTTTLMGCGSGYYDENGEYVRPVDPNITTIQYMCSNNHEFYEKIQYGKSKIEVTNK